MKLKDISISPKVSVQDSTKILESTLLCTSGIFELYFEKGSGMELQNNPNHVLRRNVICSVFNDLSNFLITPLKTPNNNAKIKIWIRNINEIPNSQNYDISYGSSYYNVPENVYESVIVDNLLWKTILSGVDSYKNNSLVSENYYHATLAFKFTGGIKWNSNLNSLASSNHYDLYTYTLREAVHALGFSSLLTSTGSSKLGNQNKYYSRFDSFLKNQNNLSLFSFGNCSSMTDIQFTGNSNELSSNCTNDSFLNNFSNCASAIKFEGSSVVNLYTPNCFNNLKSLNLTNSSCTTNSNPSLMSDGMGLGVTNRKMNIEERNILKDIGYSFNATYGNNYNYTFENYNSQTIAQSVVGINDGIDTNGNFTYTGTINEQLLITLLSNDKGANLRFECLKDLTHNGTVFSVLNGDATTSIEITTSHPGHHLISYVPYDNITGVRGNITYVNIKTAVKCANPPTNCNLVFNGDFEQYFQLPDDVTQIERACNWIAARNSPDYFHTDALNWQVDIPNNTFGNQNVLTPPGGNAYAGLAIIRNTTNSFYYEVIGTELVSPLEPNTPYQLSFNISRADRYPGAIRFQAYLGNNLTFVTQNNIAIEPNGILLTNTSFTTNANGWNTITFNFTTGAVAGQTHLYLGGLNGVFYHESNTYYYFNIYQRDLVDNLFVENSEEAINIYYQVQGPESEYSGISTFDGRRRALMSELWEWYKENEVETQQYSFASTGLWANARLLNHEIGHSLSLYHTLSYHKPLGQPGICIDIGDDYCSDTPLFDQVLNAQSPFNHCTVCSSNNANANCSSNLMDYAQLHSITPCQLGRVHWTIENEMQKYKSCDYERLNESITNYTSNKSYIAQTVTVPETANIIVDGNNGLFINSQTFEIKAGATFEVKAGSPFWVNPITPCQ